MKKTWIIVWTKKQKQALLILIILTFCLIVLLATTTWVFFSQQQNIYSSVLNNWQIVQKYNDFLKTNSIGQDTINFQNISQTELDSLFKLQTDYQSAVGSIEHDLSIRLQPDNLIAQHFYNQTTLVLEQQKTLSQSRLSYISAKYCLSQKASDLERINQEISNSLSLLELSQNTEEIKNHLQHSSVKTKELSEKTNTIKECFQLASTETQTQLTELVQPIIKSYEQYQMAVDLFVEGIDNLKVEQTETALKTIKDSQPNSSDMSKFDTFIKTNLDLLYKKQLSQTITLEIDFDRLQQSYLENRLRTIIK